MPYETFNRRGGRIKAPVLAITTYGRIGFNKGMVDIFYKLEADKVLLLWDSDQHKIGIKLLGKKESDVRAYPIGFSDHSKSGYISAKLFLDWIGFHSAEHRTYPAQWNEKEKMFEVEISEADVGGKPASQGEVVKRERRAIR